MGKTVLVEKEDYNLWERTWEATKIQYQALTLDHGKNVFFEKSAPYEDLKHSFDQIVHKSSIVSSRMALTGSFYKLSSIGGGVGGGLVGCLQSSIIGHVTVECFIAKPLI